MANSKHQPPHHPKSNMAAVAALGLLLGSKSAAGAIDSSFAAEAREALTHSRTFKQNARSHPFELSSEENEGEGDRPKEGEDRGKGDNENPEHGSHSSHSSHASHHSSHER